MASIWYLVMTSVLYVGQYYLERRYGRGVAARAARRRRCSASRQRAGARLGATASMSEPMVKAEGVHKSFGRLEVLKGITSRCSRGEVMCLLGPSGSGKSTFLRCINHLEKINAGRLSVDGELVGYREAGGKLYELREREIARKRAEIGMVFQHFNLFPHMTALENVDAARRCAVQGRARERGAASAARELLDRVGLGDKRRRLPARSSRAASSSGWRSRGRWRWSRS